MTVKYALLDLPTRVDAAVANAARAEAAGLDRYMVAQVERADPIAVLAVVADRVPRIELATGVIAIQSTLPQHLAQQARTVNQISGGRFTLGIGVCHQPIVTEAFGLEWSRPYSHMVQYLDALLPLLDGQAVDVSGDLVSHRTEIEVPGPAPGVLLAAMGPRMLALAGDSHRRHAAGLDRAPHHRRACAPGHRRRAGVGRRLGVRDRRPRRGPGPSRRPAGRLPDPAVVPGHGRA